MLQSHVHRKPSCSNLVNEGFDQRVVVAFEGLLAGATPEFDSGKGRARPPSFHAANSARSSEAKPV